MVRAGLVDLEAVNPRDVRLRKKHGVRGVRRKRLGNLNVNPETRQIREQIGLRVTTED